ncbi:hypothetical protein OS493_028630 [Desmophyllum pertusum]|uniref:Uncharacterized protein n=1 Tax=Desmophyllum pertusum TaxID=174260 RepID=A0A9W9YX06_9CNID|nr:hypothetical protein OS493_028630 [Desmophyllum pertusum]
MKHSILIQLKRTKSTKTVTKSKKTVHWSKQLEEVRLFNPESENTVSNDLLWRASQKSSLPPDHQSSRVFQTVAATGQETSELQRKLEKLSIDNERTRFTMNNRPVWRKIVDAENSSLSGEDWV